MNAASTNDSANVTTHAGLHTKKKALRSFFGVSPVAVTSYSAVFLLIVASVAIGYQPPRQANSLANINNASATLPDQGSSAAPSVDQLVATNIAADLAAQTNLPVAANLSNTSVSLTAQSELDQSSSDAISKPQIVQPTSGSNIVKAYTAVAGDTVTSVATKYNVSAQTIRWANGLMSDALTPGQTIKVPPVDGIIYTVKEGDTTRALADKYKANLDVVVAYNDLEGLDTLPKDKQIVIPGGQLPDTEQPGYTAPRTAIATRNGTNYGGNAGSINAAMASASAGNQYAFGNCTWYAYNRRAQLGMPIGSYWGNATTWASYARAAGYTVNGTPAVGAVQQNSGGWGGYGHVAIVEQIVPGEYVRISEMNAYRAGGGFNKVDFYNMPWAEAVGGGYNYIH